MKLLRPLRIVAGIVCGGSITTLFIGLSQPAWIVDAQLGPALLSLFTDRTFIGSALLVAVVLILISWLFGRVYCSTVCPLGLLQDAIMWLCRRRKFTPQRNYWRLRYLLLLGVVAAAAAGLIIPLGLLEPYSFAGRILGNVLAPAADWVNNYVYLASEGRWLEPVNSSPFAAFALAVALAGVALLIWSAASRGRLFCNTFCPLGALLGLLARVSRYRLDIDPAACTSCQACAGKCKAGCIDLSDKTIDFERCVMCFNCVAACRFSAVGMRLRKNTTEESGKTATDKSRRRFLIEAGAVGLGSLAVPPLLRRLETPKENIPIMPPGAMSLDKFTSRCTACHLCVRSCPSKVIKPALLAYGVGGIMMPQLDYRSGMCEYDCATCSNVCPTGALTPLKLRDKQTVRIGEATYYRKRCVVVTDHTFCGACAEQCPTGAIEMVPWEDGLDIPKVVTELCIGCGGCEHVCPAEPEKAMIVGGVKRQDRARRPQAAGLPPSGSTHSLF